MSDTMVNALVMFVLITLVLPAQTRLCKVLAFQAHQQQLSVLF